MNNLLEWLDGALWAAAGTAKQAVPASSASAVAVVFTVMIEGPLLTPRGDAFTCAGSGLIQSDHNRE
jgi:hypothetical protein